MIECKGLGRMKESSVSTTCCSLPVLEGILFEGGLFLKADEWIYKGDSFSSSCGHLRPTAPSLEPSQDAASALGAHHE